MENIKEEFESLYNQSTAYVDTRLELLKLQSVDKVSDVVSSVLSRMIVVITLLMFIVFVSIAVALCHGDVLGNNSYGFFIISGFYALTGLICYLFKNTWFKKPVSNLLIRKMLK